MIARYDGFNTYIYPAVEPEGPDFLDKVRTLLGSAPPTMVWVDNTSQSYRYWDVVPVYTSDGRTISTVSLAFGSYVFVMRRGTHIYEKDDGLELSGKFTFHKDGYSSGGDKAFLTGDGVLRFSIVISSPNDLDIGIKYFGTVYDGVCMRTIPVGIHSPFIKLQEPLPLNVEFSPLTKEKTRFHFAEYTILDTFYTTIYGEPVRMGFKGGFQFVFQDMPSLSRPTDYYLAPRGQADGLTSGLLMLGLSGTEYIRLPDRYTITFHPDQKAYFDDAPLACEPSVPYLSVDGGGYCSQPEESRFFAVGGEFYEYAELPSIPVQNVVLPTLPFWGMDVNPTFAEKVEKGHLSVIRRERMELQACGTTLNHLQSTEAVTRHGLRICINSNQVLWLRIAITDEVKPNIAFTRIMPRLMASLQASDLFMILCEEATLSQYAQTPYSITLPHLQMAEKNGYRQTSLLNKLADRVYYSYDEFLEAVRSVGADMDDVLRDACDHFGMTVADWRFMMNPSLWEEYGTILILKFTGNQSLAEYVHKPELWGFAPDRSRIDAVQREVGDLEGQLIKNPNAELEEILHAPLWCGVVAFHCAVDARNLPDELAFLANGIDLSRFKAEFLAFPADTGKEETGRVSAWIDYRDEVHLFSEDYRDYAFKVLQLKVCIRNNCVYDFGARVELLINRLFEAEARAEDQTEGNNLVFNGGYQKDSNGVGRYVFLLDEPETYKVHSSLIESVGVETAQLLAERDGCRFSFSGGLRLLNTGTFDLLSYDNLLYSGMEIHMQNKGGEYGFLFFGCGLRFETNGSEWRSDSFARKFPITPVKLTPSPNQTPEKSGYAPLWVEGVDTDKLGNQWYGILWTVNPGNMGNLASGIDAVIELLTAWEPDYGNERGNGPPPLFVGIRFGAAGNPDDWGLPLQGVMTLGFDAIELRRSVSIEGEAEKARYYFQFRNFSLRILGMRFPDNNNDLYLISDESRKLGWYGAMER